MSSSPRPSTDTVHSFTIAPETQLDSDMSLPDDANDGLITFPRFTSPPSSAHYQGTTPTAADILSSSVTSDSSVITAIHHPTSTSEATSDRRASSQLTAPAPLALSPEALSPAGGTLSPLELNLTTASATTPPPGFIRGSIDANAGPTPDILWTPEGVERTPIRRMGSLYSAEFTPRAPGDSSWGGRMTDMSLPEVALSQEGEQRPTLTRSSSAQTAFRVDALGGRAGASDEYGVRAEGMLHGTAGTGPDGGPSYETSPAGSIHDAEIEPGKFDFLGSCFGMRRRSQRRQIRRIAD
ncbi:hypothetical protein IAT38_002719 [Cryptococcus sp. DSM 104549]